MDRFFRGVVGTLCCRLVILISSILQLQLSLIEDGDLEREDDSVMMGPEAVDSVEESGDDAAVVADLPSIGGACWEDLFLFWLARIMLHYDSCAQPPLFQQVYTFDFSV